MKMVIGSKTELGDYAKEFDIEEELTDDDGSDESGITTGTATDQASTPTRSGLRVRFTAPNGAIYSLSISNLLYSLCRNVRYARRKRLWNILIPLTIPSPFYQSMSPIMRRKSLGVSFCHYNGLLR